MFKSLIKKYLNLPITENVSPSLMKTFGIFGMINFPLLYILGASLLSEKPIAFYLRLMGFSFCLFLALVDFWPKKLKRYQEFYWFIAITYSLPFFGTYMFIVNNASLAWQVKITVGIFWLVLITNWTQFLIILPLGMILAFLTFTLISGSIHLEMNNMWGDLLNCGWAIVIASIFARRKEIIQKEKQKSLRMQAAAIAHEMRTPLAAIETAAEGLQMHLPTLIQTQEIAQEKDAAPSSINKKKLQSLAEIPDEIKGTARSAFTVIDMLLMNLKEDVPEAVLEKCSIMHCVQTALHDYSLREEDKNLISIEIKQDFEFYGHPLTFKHVLFNLLKNALYYLKAANKGKITIWTKTGDKVNKLYFEDTGKGISKDYLPYIFDQFSTRTAHGTGVGLAFCKMVMTKLGGDITCDSVEGDYTRFILTFPVLMEDKLAY
jgi:signal transduction histidine kinase